MYRGRVRATAALGASRHQLLRTATAGGFNLVLGGGSKLECLGASDRSRGAIRRAVVPARGAAGLRPLHPRVAERRLQPRQRLSVRPILHRRHVAPLVPAELSRRQQIQNPVREVVGGACLQIAPSICQVDYVVFGNETQNEMVGFRLLRNEVLNPGGVYYIGDFTADSTWNFMAGIIKWIIKGRSNQYAKTTAEMKRVYPGFASVATEDRVPR